MADRTASGPSRRPEDSQAEQRRIKPAASGAPFGMNESFVLAKAPGAALVNTTILLALAGALLAVSLPRVLRGETDLFILPLSSIFLAFLAFASNRRRVKLAGAAFEYTGVAGTSRGSADEFMGWHRDVWGAFRLLRRSDLKWVRLTSSLGGTWPDDAIWRWVLTFLPHVEPLALGKIRRVTLPTPTRAVRLLEKPLPNSLDEFHASPRDLELACAARAVGEGRCYEARPSLHHLLQQLPTCSVALPFVFDALRVVGDDSSARLLEQVAWRYDGSSAEHWTRAFCALAARDQLQRLPELTRAEAWFQRSELERGIRRLERGSERTSA